MNTKQLRQKILDMAIKGLLVSQDVNDEPASKLLEHIREEKEQLIKEGKLKQDKNESFIFVGDDKLHYEKFSDGTVVCIEDEIPFEIPDNWAWERLGNIGEWGSGSTPSRTNADYYGGNIPWLKTGDLNDSCITFIPECITKKALEETSVRLNLTGSVLIAMYGATIGKLGILTFPATTNQACCACLPIKIYNKFLFYYLMAMKTFFIKQGEGGAQPNISKEKIVETLFPVPPLSEQQRITDTVEELLKLVDKIEQDKLDLKDLVKQTKAKVLDLAIKGKLVSQDDNDEPADKLLEKIREEKEKLIKEGKLKRDKNETYIFKNSDDNSYYEKIGDKVKCIDDDLPFKIPDSWRWQKFGAICKIERGGSPRPIEKYITNSENGINWIKIGDTEKGGKYICSTKEKIIPEGISKSRYVKAGDFLLTNSMSFGRPYILKIDGCIHDGWLVINDNYCLFNQDFLYYLLSSNAMYQLLTIAAKGSTVKNLKSDTVKMVNVPIPPQKEQEKIVQKIEQIFEQLDNIENMLKAS